MTTLTTAVCSRLFFGGPAHVLNRGVARIFPEVRTIFYNNFFMLNTSSLPLTTRFLPPFGPFLLIYGSTKKSRV